MKRRREGPLDRREAPTPVGDALQAFFRKAGIVKRIELADAVERWAEIVGPQIAAATKAATQSAAT